MPDNISKLYSALKDTYELGSEADFRKYLGDGTKREALRKELESEYEVGDSASFSKYLGFDQQGKPAGTVKEQEPSVGDMGAGVGAAVLGATGKPKVAVAQQQTQHRQPKLSQMPSGFGELDIQQANRRGLGMGPGAWGQPEPGTVNPKTGKSEPKQEKNIAKQLDRALKGDKKAAKESGLDAAVQRMREEKEYYEATGKPLANIVNTPVTAPTAVRDKDGQMLMGQTTDEQRVAQYQQQEKEIARKKIIDPIVDDIQKQLEGKVPLYTTPIKGMSAGPQWNAMMNQTEQMRRAFSADSPEKLWGELNKYFGLGKDSDEEDFTSKFLLDNQDAINEAAQRLGMDTDAFIWDELIPKMSETIAKRFNENMSEKHSVKSTADYIAKRMINSSVGALARMGTMTTRQSQLMQEELEKSGRGEGRHFNAAWYDKAVGEVAQFLPDTPLMVIGGTIGGAATKGLGAMITRAGAEGLGTMVSTGSPFLAANVGKMVKWGGLLGHSVVSGAANMGSFMGMSSMLQAMASTPVDDGYLSSVGMAGWEGIKEGAKIGTALGVLGTASGAGSGLWKTAKGRAAWAGGTFLAENQIFALSDYLADPEKFNWVDSSLDAFYMQMAGKVQGMATHGTEGIKNSWRQIFKPMSKMPTLTETEKAQIQRAFGGMSFEEIAGDMGNLEKILKDKQNIPLTIRQKISGRVLGVFEPNRPFTYNINIRGKEIYERSKEGELLQVHTFETPDERDAIMQEIADRKQHDQMAHDFIALDMKEQAAPILDSFAQEFGMTRQELWDMMQKKPIELVEDEYDLMQELGRRLHEAATPKGELHSAQSNTDGAELAGNNGLSEPDVALQLAKELSEAKEAYDNFPLNEELRIAVQSLGDARLDEIYMKIRSNYSGREVDDFLAVLADYANAKSKSDGYISKIGENIEESVQQEIDRNSFRGQLDNAPETDNIMFIDYNGHRYTVLNGSIASRIDVKTDPTNGTQYGGDRIVDTGRSGDIIIATDENGNWVSLKPDAGMVISQLMSKEEFANARREELGVQNTQVMIDSGLADLAGLVSQKLNVNPNETPSDSKTRPPLLESPGPKTASKDLPEGVDEGQRLTLTDENAGAEGMVPAGDATGTGAAGADKVEQGDNAVGEAGVNGDTGANEPPATALSRIPTLKDEQGRDILDEDNDVSYQWEQAPLEDTLNALTEVNHGDRKRVVDTVDAMIGAAEKGVKDAEKLKPKNSDPIKRAREQDAIDAQKEVAQQKLDYWTAARQELEKVNKAESELKDEPVKDNEPENVVPLQPQAASEQQKPSLKSRLQKLAERYKKKFGEFFNDDIDVPGDATELVALNIGTGRQFRWDDKPNGAGGVIRGFKTALGINTEFGGRRGSEGHAFAHLFKGKDDTTGLGFDEFVDKVWRSDENTIHGLDGNDTKRFTEQQIGDAIIDLFMSAEQGKDITEYIIRNRVEKAQKAWEAEQARLKEEAERNERIELTDEEVEKIESELPFARSTNDDIPDSPITKLDKEAKALMAEDGTPEIKVVDTDRISDNTWRQIAEREYDGAFLDEEEVNAVKEFLVSNGVFYDEKTNKITVYSGELTPEELRKRVQTIKDYINDRSNRERRNEEEDLVDERPTSDRERDKGAEKAEAGDGSQGEGRPESGGEPGTSERDEYLKPRNEKEEKIVSDVEAKLAEEIKAAEEEVKKAKSTYEKARAKESDKATDMFSDDKAFEKPDQLFSFDEMGGTDRTQEGVNRRTEEVRERLIDAQAKLDRLQSQAEHDSRVRGALDNERRQTSFEEDDVFTVTTKKNGSVNVLDKNLIPEGRATNEDYVWLYNEFNKLEGKWDEKTGWTFPKEKAEAVENILGQFKERISKEPSDNPMEAIEKASTEFNEEKKAEQKELGITTDETPEQKADRERAEKLADTPLTDAEVDSSSASDVQKTLAKAYLNGNHGLLQTAAYLNVYNDVRNRRQDNETNRSDADGTQLAGLNDREERRPGQPGEPTGELADEGDVPLQDDGNADKARVQRVEDSTDNVPASTGERGDSSVSESESEVDRLPAGSEQPVGSSGDRSNGRDVRPTGAGERGSGVAGQAEQREIEARHDNSPKPAAGSDAAIAASKQRLADLRKRFKKAGRNGELSISLVGMNNEQIGILGEIITESANLGYQYIAKGLHEFNEWKKQMWEDFHDWLHEDMKWTDAEIDEYMQEVWNCEYNINGVTRTIGEWASFIGQEKMREVVREDLSTKFEKQKAAESVETKVGDIDNIRESLPYLLPEQQDDVLKAETQFFNGQHQDRQHGFGKGMMFTNGTGTGKTYTGLGIVKRFVKQGKGRVLILTPSQEKVSDWRNDGLNLGLNIESLDEEAKIKGTSATKAKGKGVVVTTYANARQNLAMLEDCFDLIVYDESHKIMESKEATNTTMMDFHEMLTNKNVERSMDRQTYWLPEWVEHRNLLKEREENRERLDVLSNYGDNETVKVDGKDVVVAELKANLNARMRDIETRLEELRPIMQEIRESKRPQAEIDTKRTKTVFLSATPFNVRESLRYAEGYLFSFPEEDKNTIGTYNHRSPEDAFLEQMFPAGYRWRYGRLESHVSNAEALGRQEIDFSDYLQNTLQTMSGRMIASDYDYSRDFPVLTLDHAGRFNQAMSEVYRNKRYQPLAEAFKKSFDYNYSTALFEAMKTSLVNERIKEHLARGQKVVVFHRRRTSGDLEPPFRRALDAASVMASMEQDGKRKSDILSAIAAFEHDFADMLEWEKTLDYTLPREQIERRFGKDNVAFFSGAETKSVKHKSVEEFMKDNGGKDIIVIQEASGKEGISLHDKTGEHQRVEINLALPQSPIAFIQIEGRIYRIGQKSNAIFEYPLLGLDLETNLFAQKFNNALGTTENLALGSKARNLRKSIANSVLENTGEVDYERQGLGGKDMDGRVAGGDDKDGFDVSIQDYYGNQKMQRGRDNREGVDYFPTPEPIGYKMVEWGMMMEGETALEPSAGHGAIARYVPETNGMTAIEPSSSLFTKLQMRAGGPGRRFEEMPFENYPLGNKHDVVLMNPPYGVGGKTAMEHVAKAFRHLNEGGRVIAIIPDGPAMEKRLDAWLNGDGETAAGGAAVVTGEVKLPSVAFGRAGTNVRTRIVVIDKVSRAEMRQKAPQKVTVDLSGEESIAGLFDRIRNVRMPERTIDQVAINTKKALRTKRALEDNPFTSLFEITRDGYLRVRSKSRYDVSEIWLNLENPNMENVLLWYRGLKETMENPDKLEHGKYKTKTYGTGKNKVPALDAIKDYCQQAIKTLENVTGMTADQMDKAVREQEAERERKRQEREAEYQRQREERARQEREKLDSIKRNIEEGFTGEGIYNDVEQLKRMVDLYHSRGSGLFEKRRAKFNLEQAGFDPETGKKIDKNEPVNARTSTVVQPAGNAAGTVATQRKADYEYKLDKNTRTGEDMHLVSYNGARLSDNDYRAVERKAKALGGYYNRFKKAFHFKTAEEAQKFAESLNGTTQEPGTTTRFRLREKEAPKKTQKVYKLMRLGDDGKLYPLFIDSAAPTELGKWYDADSPDLSILQKMPSGTFLVDYKNGTYTSMEDYAKEHGMKMGKYPSKEAVNDATSNGLRWVRIEDTGRSQRRYGGESRKYMNLGINGSGTVSEFAMRPGWHAGSLPSMRQIGKGKDRNLRDDRFVWVEGEVPADREWQSVADQNPDKDIPTQIPEDGFYMKATNANKAASQADRIGWYVAGAFKANRIMSDVEARNVITKWNKEHPDQPVEYDFERESGKDFNAETMQLEDRPTTRFRFAKDKEEFDKIREDAVRSKGLVVKGLNDANVSITHVSNHDFGERPIDKARDWAIKNLVTSEEDIKNNKLPKMKDGTPYVISKKAIGKYLSEDGMANSDNQEVHLSVLKKLKDVISESIEAEVHPDYPKVDGVRTTEKYNDNALIHRLYGAVEIDGKVYRVKTTMQEFRGSEANKPHSYEVTKIELLDSPMTASESPSVNVGQHKTDTKESTNNSISGAKLLKDVEKSYDSGKKLLDESEKSTFFRKGEPSQTPLETDYRRKEEAGRKLAKKLNSDFEAVTELDQIQNKEVRDAIAAGHEVPGWIEIGKDGKKKIFMFLPHVRDTYDAEKTIAHETIGHQGLRELLGEKGYKSYCQSLLYELKDPELQKYWTEKLAKNGFDTYRTIDEFLAEAAEKGYGDLSMWQKVKNAMTDALRSAGFTMSPSISDVKYMVWLSKHNLEKGNVMNQVEREALLFRLGRERYEAKVKNGEFTYEGGRDTTTDTTRVPYFPGDGKTLFRHTPSVKNQRMNYERSLKRIGYVWKEAHIDAMQSAIELMRSISGVKKIEDIPSAENFVLLENQMSSKEEQMDFLFNRDYMKPLDDAVGKCLPDMGNGVDEQLRNLQLYMIKKHGLERNRVLFVRDAIRALRKDSAVDQKQVDDMEQDYFDTMRGLRDDLRNGNIDLREYFEEVDKWIGHNMPEYKVGEKDYSGLSSMGKPSGAGVGYDDAGIIDEVMSTESMLGKERVDGLWEKTKAVSQFGLDMEYEGGLDSKEKHDKVSEMFEWYVPLRGYDEKTAEEVYDYLEEGGNDRKWAGPVLMNAKGRESLADVDVFATLGAMSSSAINRSLRNQMKQAFARFVRSHYNEVGADQRLVTELPYLWAEKQYDPVTGQDVWVEKFPDIPEGAKADDVAAILDQYQQDMEVKEANGNAKRVRQNSNIPFRPADKEHKAQHIVDVWINGEKHSFVVNGNPRAAQAVNGQLKAERNSNILWLSSLSHFMAKMNTSYSPDFIMRNTERDLIYSAANIAVKENAEYWLRWAKNYGVAIGRVASGVPAMHTNLFKRYREGTLNMANATDRYFKEFMENGGETGWVERKNLDKWKKAIKEGVSKDSTPEKVGKVVINALPDAIEAMNERAENMARFATYMTSREMGRTITRSVSDAKEVSVNFNRKGAGRKTVSLNRGDDSWLSNANAYMAGWSAQNLQDYIMFYNAGVQGMTNMIKNVANHPIKGTTAFAAFALAGMLMPQLNQYLFEEDDDKTGKEPENPYAELPEYVRRNNLCIYNDKGSFITIALPIELRAMYGIGDMAASYINHPELRSTKNMGEDIVTQLSQVAPLDFFGEGAGPMWAMVPSGIRPFAEAAANKNWLGQPIERDEERWNKNKPRWTRAFKNVGDAYVGASKRLNAATNPYHDENIKGWADGAITDPALVEHIVNGYFGGVGSTVNRVAQLAKHANEMSPKEAITSNWMPIVRTQHYTPNERTRYARTRNKWWYYKEEADKTQETIKVLKKRGEEDPMSYMKSVSEKEGKKGSRAMIMAEAYKRYSAAKKALENTDDLQEKNLYQLQMDQIMEETVKKLEKIK